MNKWAVFSAIVDMLMLYVSVYTCIHFSRMES